MRTPVSPLSVLVGACVVLGLLVLAGCASGPRTSAPRPDLGANSTFPIPSEIADNVDFWRHVYGIWGRGEVAIHDSEHLGVIYEVLRIPGTLHKSLTPSQKSFINARKRHHRERVRALARRVGVRGSLSRADRALLAKFKHAGGRTAIYGAAERVRAQRGLRERFRRGVEISGRYDATFRRIMRAHGVPEDLAYLPHVESSFQAHARSSVGAGGIWQFMPGTGRLFMTVNNRVDERFDPILAADGAAKYLAQAARKLGRSWPLAITSYNHGQGGMAKAKAIYGDDIGRIVTEYRGKSFGFASRNFYAEFMAAREVARHPKRYFPEGIHYERPWSNDRLVLNHSLPVGQIARHYRISTARLAELNLHMRDSVRSGRKNLPSGTTLWLPEGTTRSIAQQPVALPTPVRIARAQPVAAARKLTSTARSTKPRPEAVKRKAAKPVVARATKKASKTHKSKPRSVSRYHVVKSKETLYRVAVENGLTVNELRKLNKMGANDTHIQVGQKLRIGI